jgi:hypothetical protein
VYFFFLRDLLKFTKSCQKCEHKWNIFARNLIYQSSNQEMFAISLSSCSRYNSALNWANQCPLFMTVRYIFQISEDGHPPNTPTSLVTHARDNWWTQFGQNCFSPSRRREAPCEGTNSPRTSCTLYSISILYAYFRRIVEYMWSNNFNQNI